MDNFVVSTYQTPDWGTSNKPKNILERTNLFPSEGT